MARLFVLPFYKYRAEKYKSPSSNENELNF